MSGVPPALPEVDGDACVHALLPHASCRACVEACPRAAWVLDDDGLGLDTSACDPCGLCVPACPRGAIALPRPVVILHDPHGFGSAWLACEKAEPCALAPIPCAHALGVADLDRMSEEGVRTLTVLTGPCEACARNGGRSDLFAAGDLHSRISASQGRAGVAVKRLDPRSFDRLLARAREDHERIDRGRRRLFGALVSSRATRPESIAAEAPLSRYQPVIDRQTCVACDACIRICPDEALALGAGAKRTYVIRPEACSGCRLCLDVCDRGAMALTAPGPAKMAELPLDSGRCRACGVVYFTLTGTGAAGSGLCRICSASNHHKNLFQVFGDE